MPDRALEEQLDQAIELLLAGAPPVTGGDAELAALAVTAGRLRDLTSEDFKIRLKNELKRRTSMSTLAAAPIIAGVREGFRTIAPFLIHANAPGLVDFIKSTFGAEEMMRKTGGDAYGFYSEVRIGDSRIMIGGGTAAQWGNLPAALHVYVPDCDAAYRRALDAGAVTLMGARGEPTDQPYGERSASVRDIFGNYWYIATHLASAKSGAEAAAEDLGSVLPYLHPKGARKYIDFLKRAFGAEEMAVYEQADRVMHGSVRIGNAVLEMGEPEDRTGIPSNGLFLYVEDVEAVYTRALAAGATSVRPPADEPYGLHSAVVRDPEGYFWWPARWSK
jgi:PhnB protein